MKTLAFVIFFISFFFRIHAQQHSEFGLQIQANAATQLVKNPAVPKNGTFGWAFIKTWGIGVYRNHHFSDRFALRNRLIYSQKGFKHHAQYALGSSQIKEVSSRYRLHYVSIDKLIQYSIGKSDSKPYIIGGIRGDVLISDNMPEQFGNPQGTQPIKRGDFRALGLGGIAGMGIKLHQRMILQGDLNFDILPTLKQPDAAIRNWMWSLSLGFNLVGSDS